MVFPQWHTWLSDDLMVNRSTSEWHVSSWLIFCVHWFGLVVYLIRSNHGFFVKTGQKLWFVVQKPDEICSYLIRESIVTGHDWFLELYNQLRIILQVLYCMMMMSPNVLKIVFGLDSSLYELRCVKIVCLTWMCSNSYITVVINLHDMLHFNEIFRQMSDITKNRP